MLLIITCCFRPLQKYISLQQLKLNVLLLLLLMTTVLVTNDASPLASVGRLLQSMNILHCYLRSTLVWWLPLAHSSSMHEPICFSACPTWHLCSAFSCQAFLSSRIEFHASLERHTHHSMHGRAHSTCAPAANYMQLASLNIVAMLMPRPLTRITVRSLTLTLIVSNLLSALCRSSFYGACTVYAAHSSRHRFYGGNLGSKSASISHFWASSVTSELFRILVMPG